jgi:predicted AlkP superfamily pyrophosphatase or phosphodiesterase
MARSLRALTRLRVAIVVLWSAAVGAAEAPRVVLIVVDGLDARTVSEALTPTLWKLAHGPEPRDARGVFYPEARAVLPTVTNANHAALFTGVFPAAHGIVGNFIWDREGTARRKRLENRDAVAVTPLFEELARSGEGRRSAVVFGKWKLVSLFGPAESSPAIHAWGDLVADREFPDLRTGLASDERTMDEVLLAIVAHAPELVAVNLGDVDRTSHIFGPDSAQAKKSVLEADRQLARLVSFLRDTDRWPDTVLVVTADHGFSSVVPDEAAPHRTLSFARELRREGIGDAAVVGNGAMAFVYLKALGPAGAVPAESQERLRRIRALALAQPEIAEALYRVPNPADGGEAHTLEVKHPDWRLAHPRAGELVLVARQGHQFDDPPGARVVRGNHGGPHERSIPLFWSGGWAGLAERRVEKERQAESPDVGMTIRRVLGLGPPRDAQGTEIDARLRGRILDEIFARPTSTP